MREFVVLTRRTEPVAEPEDSGRGMEGSAGLSVRAEGVNRGGVGRDACQRTGIEGIHSACNALRSVESS